MNYYNTIVSWDVGTPREGGLRANSLIMIKNSGPYEDFAILSTTYIRVYKKKESVLISEDINKYMIENGEHDFINLKVLDEQLYFDCIIEDGKIKLMCHNNTCDNEVYKMDKVFFKNLIENFPEDFWIIGKLLKREFNFYMELPEEVKLLLMMGDK